MSTNVTGLLLRAAFHVDPELCAKLTVSRLNQRARQAALIAIYGGTHPDKLIDIPVIAKDNPEMRTYNQSRIKLQTAVAKRKVILRLDKDVIAMLNITGGVPANHDQREALLLKIMEKMGQAIRANKEDHVINLAKLVKFIFSGEEIMGEDALLGRIFGLFCEHNLGTFMYKRGLLK